MIYDDEIIKIEEYDEIETIDIEVDGNHLFFANRILTHNSSFNADSLGMADTAESIGVPQTADTMIGIVANEDVPDKQFISILKSRSIDKNKICTTAVNVDIEHQRVTEITDGRSKRMTTGVKETLHQMETFVETAETLTLNTNTDLSSMFNTPI